MINKKNKAADLERKRFAFFQLGLIVALATTLLAFEYSAAKGQERQVDLQLPEEPIVSFMPTEAEREPEEERPNTGSIPTPVVPVMQTIIDSVIIDSAAVDPYRAIYIPDPGPKPFGGEPVLIPEPPSLPGDPIITDWTRQPEFPGGLAAMNEFILKNVRYPQHAIETQTSGTVYVEFVINRDGTICEVVAKNKLDAALEKEAIRVVSMMPNWKPGEQAGKTVRVRYLIPIRFSLQ
jgi:periplasmic protein TonB